MSDISKIDFTAIGNNLNDALAKINKKLDDIDVKNISENAVSTLKSVRALAENKDVEESIKKLDSLLGNADGLITDARTELKSFSGNVSVLSKRMDEMLLNVNSVVAPNSPFRYQLALLLKTLNGSMHNISNFADYLQRNPNSIITGKDKSGR